MRHETRYSQSQRSRQAFTLAELFVVVLAGTITAWSFLHQISTSALVVKSQQRLNMLAVGAVAYFHDNGRYPGQDDWGKTQLSDKTLTGSQLLARALFSDLDGTGFPKSNYAQYLPGETLETLADKANSLADGWPKEQRMAICYYPARLGVSGITQFVAGDNAPYTTPDKLASALANVIKNPSAPNTPYKAGQFILIAPGLDRKYFSADDINNFAPQ